jgi:DNA polymerase-3 subunit beta
MPIKDFKEMIGQTIFAVSDDETRFNMNGLYLEKASVDDSEKLIMVSTDGRRMSYCEKTPGFKIPDFPGAIIPVKIMNIVQKRAGDEGNIQISISDKMIFIKFGSYELSSVLIDGNYPEYRRVIPEGQTNSFIVNAGELLEALKRVAILVEQKTRRIFLNITSSGISVRSDESDIGDAAEEIACQYSGEDIAIALNYRYIEEPIKALASEEVQVWFTTPGKPLTIKPVPEADYFHIVMPIHLD